MARIKSSVSAEPELTPLEEAIEDAKYWEEKYRRSCKRFDRVVVIAEDAFAELTLRRLANESLRNRNRELEKQNANTKKNKDVSA